MVSSSDPQSFSRAEARHMWRGRDADIIFIYFFLLSLKIFSAAVGDSTSVCPGWLLRAGAVTIVHMDPVSPKRALPRAHMLSCEPIPLKSTIWGRERAHGVWTSVPELAVGC